jgi:hypothetical protein
LTSGGESRERLYSSAPPMRNVRGQDWEAAEAMAEGREGWVEESAAEPLREESADRTRRFEDREIWDGCASHAGGGSRCGMKM